MKRGSNLKKMLKIMKKISYICLAITLISLQKPKEIKAMIKEDVNEECSNDQELFQTAYLDMSYMGPLHLTFTEEDSGKKPDYYYAALAYKILNERINIDPMYYNCKQVIVTINHAYSTNQVMLTNCEPQVQTGYLNLLSRETSKYYMIDHITIHIQRDH